MSKKWLLLLPSLLIFAQPAMAVSNSFTTELDNNVNDALNSVLSSSGSDIFLMVSALATFILFICIVKEVSMFVMGRLDVVSLLTTVILYIGAIALIGSYGTFTNIIKGGFTDIADVYQNLIIGSSDKMYLSNFIDNVINKAVQAPDVGFTDTIFMWAVTIIWSLVSLLLQIAFYLADVYVTLGYALARLVGVIFIPFLIAGWTRPIFDGWVKFFIGWGICGLLLRISCILSMIVMKSAINAAGSMDNPGTAYISSGYDVSAPLVVTADNIYTLIAIIVFSIISCVMIFSSFSFAKMLCSGVGSASNAATGAAKNLAVKAAAALL